MEVSTTEKRSRNLGRALCTEKALIGRQFEDEGCLILKKLGYQILQRNVRFTRGEVDIVARHPSGYRVVVEVRGRQSHRFKPIAMLTASKKQRLLQLAMALTRRAGIIHRVEFLEITGVVGGKLRHQIYRIENDY